MLLRMIHNNETSGDVDVMNQIVTEPLKLFEIHSRAARHILAARSWCILRRAGHDPMSQLSGYLQYEAVATRFGLLMETVTQIWPYPFGIHRPCCPTASMDEALLAEAIEIAGLQRRPEFDRLLQEMLSVDARNMLFARAYSVYEA